MQRAWRAGRLAMGSRGYRTSQLSRQAHPPVI